MGGGDEEVWVKGVGGGGGGWEVVGWLRVGY